VLIGEIDRKLPPDAKEDAQEKSAKRQANASVALLKMDRPEKVWRLLQHSPDPRVRSYLIHRLGPLGADAKTIVKRLQEESDISTRRALILSLGEFGDKDFTHDERKPVTEKLEEIYRKDADPGLHAAAEWLLRSWKYETWLKQENEKWAKDIEQREKRLDAIKQSLAKEKEKAAPQWYVNGQGQTMVVVPGPVEFLMGSPPTEMGRMEREPQHKKRIGRTFAIAAKAVTVEQYRQFDEGYSIPAFFTRTADLPMVGISWYMAAAYCNWLSKQEGIPEDQWCYETDAKGQVTKLKEKYLNLAGYRLPTETEMEYGTWLP
jgi:eukaryotic-like serine/threonine-protein kinase